MILLGQNIGNGGQVDLVNNTPASFKDFIIKAKERADSDSFGAGDGKKIEEIKKYFGGSLPPTYEIFLKNFGHGFVGTWEFNGTGKSKPPAIIYSDRLQKNGLSTVPDHYILITNIGDDVSWYFDTSSKKENEELEIVGFVDGLSIDEQPKWLRKQEIYESFEDFFRKKTELANG